MRQLVITFFVLFTLFSCGQRDVIVSTAEELKILALVADYGVSEWDFDDEEGFFFVKKETTLPDSYFYDTEYDYQAYIKIEGINVGRMIENLKKCNQTTATISALPDTTRLVLDTEDIVGKYFAKGAFGWDELYMDYPHFAGVLCFSRPYFDVMTKKGVLYIERSSGGTAGFGGLIFFSIKDDTLTLIESFPLWVS